MTKEKIILWCGAFVITFLTSYLSILLSPDYPVSGTIGIEGKKVSYKFDKTHFGKDNFEIIIRTDVKDLTGKIFWKNDSSIEPLITDLNKIDLILSGKIPLQKPDSKIEYYVMVYYGDKSFRLPAASNIDLKFYGNIPAAVSFLQFFSLYLGLLLSIRAGLEYFSEKERIKKFEIFTCIVFIILTIMINPLYLSYKFGFINSSVPSIVRLFPPKLVSILFVWIISTILTFSIKKYKIIPVIAAIITMLLFIVL